jgi:hypothetical protein
MLLKLEQRRSVKISKPKHYFTFYMLRVFEFGKYDYEFECCLVIWVIIVHL